MRCCLDSSQRSVIENFEENRSDRIIKISFYALGMLLIISGVLMHFLSDQGNVGGMILFGSLGAVFIFAALMSCKRKDMDRMAWRAAGLGEKYDQIMRERLIDTVLQELASLDPKKYSVFIAAMKQVCAGDLSQRDGQLLTAIQLQLKNAEQLLRECGAEMGIAEELAQPHLPQSVREALVNKKPLLVDGVLMTPLHLARAYRLRCVADSLKGPKETALEEMEAAAMNFLDDPHHYAIFIRTIQLIARGGDHNVNARYPVSYEEGGSKTLLEWALSKRMWGTAQMLMDKGAEYDEKLVLLHYIRAGYILGIEEYEGEIYEGALQDAVGSHNKGVVSALLRNRFMTVLD